MAADNINRKRKQDYSDSKPLSSWSEYVYSTPNSPSQTTSNNYSMDVLFNSNNTNEYEHMRRHSVAVGELLFHSSEQQKHEQSAQYNRLLNASIPSSWSSSSSNGSALDQQYPMLHRRAMSLRLDTHLPPHSDIHTPTTPAFFSPSFLDALNTEDDHISSSNDQAIHNGLIYPNISYSNHVINDFILQNNSEHSDNYQHGHYDIGHPLNDSSNSNNNSITVASFNNITTITPSAISNDMNEYWLMNQSTTMDEIASTHKPLHPTSPSNTSSISATPSPPITPLQISHMTSYENPSFQHPSIPEEDEDIDIKCEYDDIKMNKHSIISSRIQLGKNNAQIMKPIIQHYLLTSEGERRVSILTSKVAQKSYGTEKRFLCPPPSTILSGSSWWTTQQCNEGIFKSTLHPPSINVHILGEKTSQKGVIEWYSTNSTIPDNTSRILLDSSSVIIANNQGDTLSGNCVTKQLHINDADEKRKRVEVLVKLQLGNGAYLGTFHSKGIKVISKPSKKRQSVKNMELCIHHGTTVSLFNRIRSQTVSTKYLGVLTNGSASRKDSGTCFVARTNSWDPFVIWIVDTTHSDQSRESLKNNHHPINPHYPAPPAIALKTTPKQAPIALHYNQPVVLQCVRTGLVSPIMVIRKVDKGSMVLGGNRIDDLSGVTGGEFGDEALGDPVSQLHKVAFQIVNDQHSPDSNKTAYKTTPYHTEWLLPQKSSNNISYLACLNDVVGMHKTTNPRTIVVPRPFPPPSSIEEDILLPWSDSMHVTGSDPASSIVSQQEEGKITRKRRVSCDVIKSSALPTKFQSSITTKNNRHRVNSLTETHVPIKTEGAGRRSSTSTFTDRRCSVSSNTGMYQMNGACWIEDVSDAAIWTIVGTNCATYKFYTPPSKTHSRLNSPFTNHQNSSPITPFPVLSSSSNYTANSKGILNLMGENLTRDISVWFGDIKSRRTDYKSREYISCVIPELDELMRSPVSTVDKDKPSKHRIPLLFVRGDGIIYRTDLFYIY